MATKKVLSDELIITTLLTTNSKQECANVLGITPQTISKKFRNQKFVDKYHQAQSDILRNVVNRLSGATDKAMDILIKSLEDEEVPISLRLQTAKDILRMNREYIETDELSNRISLLEANILD